MDRRWKRGRRTGRRRKGWGPEGWHSGYLFQLLEVMSWWRCIRRNDSEIQRAPCGNVGWRLRVGLYEWPREGPRVPFMR